jgi:hypothetical protein
MSVIWPGLDRIVREYSAWSVSKRSAFSYPVQVYPPLPGFDRGTYDSDFMNGIVELRRRLRPMAKAGGRTHMTSTELRAAIFAVRVNAAWWRSKKVRNRKVEQLRTKEMLGIDPATLNELTKKSARTIRSLERYTKRADYRLRKLVPAEAFSKFMNSWRANLRWIRLHLAYFKPLQPRLLEGRKTAFQIILNELIDVAKEAMEREGYLSPNDHELRRVMRLYSCSSRRFREGPYTAQYIFEHHSSEGTRWHLIEFIEKRIPLKLVAQA